MEYPTWFHCLSDLGSSIRRQADKISDEDTKIKRLEKQLKDRKKTRKKMEDDLLKEVTLHWSPIEINEAHEIFKAGGRENYTENLLKKFF